MSEHTVEHIHFFILLFAALPYYVIGFCHLWHHFKKPKINLQFPRGSMYRHWDFKNCRDWGLIQVQGLLGVSNKNVTIVDAQLHYYMKEEHLHGCVCTYEDFPPKATFHRVTSKGSVTFSDADRGDLSFGLVTDKESPFRFVFQLSGNFATEYGDDFFKMRGEVHEGLFFQFFIKFHYIYNGSYYWTEEFPVMIAPYGNKILLRDGSSSYVDEEGNIQKVITRTSYGRCQIAGEDDDINSMLSSAGLNDLPKNDS